MAKSINLLLVEDNPGDVDLIKEGLESGRIPMTISVAGDGRAALAALRHKPPFADTPRPDLILLDINLPALSGVEVLREIKSDEFLRRIPVVMLTSSDSAQDIATCYDLGANCYLVKPGGLGEFQSLVSAIESFWLSVAKLP